MVALTSNNRDDGEKYNLKIQDKTKSSKKCQQNMMTMFFIATMAMFVAGMILCAHLTFQIKMMKEELDINKNKIDELIRKSNVTKVQPIQSINETLSGQERRKRQTDDEAIPLNYLTGAHLVGIRGVTTPRKIVIEQVPAPDTFFYWGSEDDIRCTTNRMVEVVAERTGTFLRIERTGFYFVYSQVTYYSKGRRPIGHETVRVIGERQDVLMRSVGMQRLGNALTGRGNRMRNLDSAYHGGLFYLYENDLIGVRACNSHIGNQHFHTESTKSFFGLYFLSE